MGGFILFYITICIARFMDPLLDWKNAILKRIYFFFLHEMYGLNMIKKIHINLNRYTFY